MRIRTHVTALIAVSVLATSSALAAAWNVGDKVQYYEYGWHDATIAQVGSGANTDQYLVQPDRFPNKQWIVSKNIQASPGPVAPPALGIAPRSGDYSVMSYGNPRNPIRLGKISLSEGGRYRFYDNGDNLLGEGQYAFANGEVTWRTGILQTYGWTGGVKIGTNGREHSLRLQRSTFAINTPK